MALNQKLSTLAANVAADAVCALLNSGFLDIYDGVQPANANTAITSQVLLASLGFAATAFSPAVDGVAIAYLPPDTDANASGTMTWFRLYETDHVTVVADGSAGAGVYNLSVGSPVVVIHGSVIVTSLIYTQRKS